MNYNLETKLLQSKLSVFLLEKLIKYKKKYIILQNQFGYGAGASIMSEELQLKMEEEYIMEEQEMYTEKSDQVASDPAVVTSSLATVASSPEAVSDESRIPVGISANLFRQRLYNLLLGKNDNPYKVILKELFQKAGITDEIFISVHDQLIKGLTLQNSPLYKLIKEKQIPLDYSLLFPEIKIHYNFIDVPFNIFGCPLSTDIDIIISLPSDTTKEMINLPAIKEKVITFVGDSRKDLDINFVHLDKDGNLKSCSKGTKETQNICFYTYGNHKQMYPPIFSKPVVFSREMIYQKLLYVYTYLTNPKNFRYIYNVYIGITTQDKITRLKSINKTLKKFKILNLEGFMADKIKSLVVKISQAIIIAIKPERIPEIYAKKSLANLIGEQIGCDPEYILALITRGKLGNYDIVQINICFQKLIDIFIILTSTIDPSFINI